MQVHDDQAEEILRADGARVEWRVLHCKSRQEKRVCQGLAALGVDCFLPMVPRDRRYEHRLRRVEIPLFSGYVFMRGRKQDAFSLISAKRVVRVIPVPDQDVFVSEIEQIKRAVALGAYLDPCPAIRKGWRVRIATGPFIGLEGLVEKKIKPGRLVLQVDVLGQGANVDISAWEVEPLAEPQRGLKGGR